MIDWFHSPVATTPLGCRRCRGRQQASRCLVLRCGNGVDQRRVVRCRARRRLRIGRGRGGRRCRGRRHGGSYDAFGGVGVGVGAERLPPGPGRVFQSRLVHPKVEPTKSGQRPDESEEDERNAVAQIHQILLMLFLIARDERVAGQGRRCPVNPVSQQLVVFVVLGHRRWCVVL